MRTVTVTPTAPVKDGEHEIAPAGAMVSTGGGSIIIPVEETILVANELLDIWLKSREAQAKEQEE